ncbi:MAG: hypothetical protein JWM68_1718 [Verrucomicrobiales bacterium]|nr:hypothetical protein [Verrucomicrobiales bacterium]
MADSAGKRFRIYGSIGEVRPRVCIGDGPKGRDERADDLRARHHIVVRSVAGDAIFDHDIAVVDIVHLDSGQATAGYVVIFDTVVGVVDINPGIARTRDGVVSVAGVADHFAVRKIHINAAVTVVLDPGTGHGARLHHDPMTGIVDGPAIAHGPIGHQNANVFVVIGFTPLHQAAAIVDSDQLVARTKTTTDQAQAADSAAGIAVNRQIFAHEIA